MNILGFVLLLVTLIAPVVYLTASNAADSRRRVMILEFSWWIIRCTIIAMIVAAVLCVLIYHT